MGTDNKDWFYNSKEFQAFFKSSTRSCVVKVDAPRFTIIAVSDNYLKLTHRKKEDMLGFRFFDIFPGNAIIAAQKESLLHSFEKVITQKETDVLPLYQYQIQVPDTGEMLTQYWSNTNEPIFDDEGNVAYIIRTVTNITDQLLAQKAAEETDALRESQIKNSEHIQLLNKELLAANEKLNAIIDEQNDINKELQKAQQDLLESNKQLVQSKQRFRLLIQQAPVAINEFKTRELIVDNINEKMLHIWGKSLNEVLGKPFKEALPEINDQPFLSILDTVFTSGQPYFGNEQKALIVKDGIVTEGYFTFIYQPIRNENKEIISILQVVTDVTEQVTARLNIQTLNNELFVINTELHATNEHLKHSQHIQERTEEMMRLAVEAANMGIWYMHADTHELIASPRLKELYGFHPTDEITLENLLTQITDDHRDAIKTGIEDAIHNNGVFDVSYTVLGYHDKKLRWVRAMGSLIKDVTGNFSAFTGVITDITEQVQARTALQKVNEELAASIEEQMAINEELVQAQEDYFEIYNQLIKSKEDLLFTIDAAALATFDLNPMTGTFNGNDLLKQWFGLAKNEEIKIEEAMNVVAEADREPVLQAFSESLNPSQGGIFESEYTIINPHNPVPRIVRSKGKTLFNENGEAIRLSGTLQDITEQKKDEQRKNDFIGMVSHEMKTPLTSMSGYLQMLQMNAKKAKTILLLPWRLKL